MQSVERFATSTVPASPMQLYYEGRMVPRPLRYIARKGAATLSAVADAQDLRTVLRLRGAGIFKLPVLFGELRPHMAPVIVDVGAARGESAHWALRVFPHALIHSIEPIGTEFAALEEAARSNTRWYVHHMALGERIGSRDLIVCEHIKQASSFFPPAHVSIQAWPQQDFASRRTERVQVKTLAGFARENGLDRIDVLKLDVQGAELEVLKGADGFLERVRYIISEVAFQPMYEGGCLFTEVLEYLHSKGRYLRAFANEFRDPSGRMIQADALFG